MTAGAGSLDSTSTHSSSRMNRSDISNRPRLARLNDYLTPAPPHHPTVPVSEVARDTTPQAG